MASFLGIGIGILLGRAADARHDRDLPAPPARRSSGSIIDARAQRPGRLARTSSSSASPRARAADVNFLVLPLVFALVTALMASLAIPLGPLLRSMPPLQAYAWDIAGSMLGIAGFTILSAAGTTPLALVRRRGGPRHAAPRRVAPARPPADPGRGRARPSSLPRRERRGAAARSGRRTTGSTRTRRGNGELSRQRQRHPPSGAAPGRRRRKEQFYDQLYKWFPGPDVPRGPDRRRGLAARTSAIALAHGARPRRCRRDRPGDPADRHRLPPRPAVPGSARHPLRERRPRVPPRHATRSTTWSSSPCRTR